MSRRVDSKDDEAELDSVLKPISIRVTLGAAYKNESINVMGDLITKIRFEVHPADVHALADLASYRGKVFYVAIVPEGATEKPERPRRRKAPEE